MNSPSIFSYSQITSQRRNNKRRIFKIAIFSTTILMLLSLGLVNASSTNPNSISQPNNQKAEKLAATDTTDAGGSSEPVKAGSAITVSASTVPDCVPVLSFQIPVAPKISSNNPGLVQSPTITNSYLIYGASASQIMNQIYKCTPVSHEGSRYAASVEYVINWSFQYQPNGTGLCTISKATVGLSINKTMPQWKPVETPSQALQSRWNSYIKNLDKHEEGHVNINRQYAEKILSNFQNYPPSPCATINASANARANSIINELNAANEAYDQTTSHGASEGALL